MKVRSRPFPLSSTNAAAKSRLDQEMRSRYRRLMQVKDFQTLSVRAKKKSRKVTRQTNLIQLTTSILSNIYDRLP
jgi:hypothetical protein